MHDNSTHYANARINTHMVEEIVLKHCARGLEKHRYMESIGTRSAQRPQNLQDR